MKKILIASLIFISSSCNETNLSNNYYYLSEYESMDMGFPYGSIIYKGLNQNHFDSIIIHSDISHIKKLGALVIIKQKPNFEILKKYYSDKGISTSWQVYEKDSINYFILDTKKNKLIKKANLNDLLKEINRLKINSEFLKKENW